MADAVATSVRSAATDAVANSQAAEATARAPSYATPAETFATYVDAARRNDAAGDAALIECLAPRIRAMTADPEHGQEARMMILDLCKTSAAVTKLGPLMEDQSGPDKKVFFSTVSEDDANRLNATRGPRYAAAIMEPMTFVQVDGRWLVG